MDSSKKKFWLKRLARLRIDSEKPNSPSGASGGHDEPPNRTRTGVFRSFRKMHNRVKSCVSRQKFRAVTSKSSSNIANNLEILPEVPPRTLAGSVSLDENIICDQSISDDYSLIPANLTNPGTSDSTNEETAEEQSCNALTKEISNLANCCWYWGPLTRQEAEKKLSNLPDGSFLIRDTSSHLYLFSISFRSLGNTFHSHIEHVSNGYSLYNQVGFPTIAKLVENAMAMSKESVYCYSRYRDDVLPAFPVRLTRPVSRFTQVRSLQYLCRFVIRQYTNINNISNLPIPVSLQSYLQQGHY